MSISKCQDQEVDVWVVGDLVKQFKGQILRAAANNRVRGHASVCGYIYAPPLPLNIKSDKIKVKQSRRDFRRGNYEEIRKSLELIDWNDKMNNKTATECWNILRGELDSAIDSYVPMKKQGQRSKKKHLSKVAFRKIRYKQNMWQVYKHTGTDKDYDAYKEALNAATNEVRKSKRNFEHKLAQHIKSDSNSFYAYVRSKQKVRDKYVGPLEDNAGNIITQGFLMAEELNMHFSSVFTREDTSSIPVPDCSLEVFNYQITQIYNSTFN